MNGHDTNQDGGTPTPNQIQARAEMLLARIEAAVPNQDTTALLQEARASIRELAASLAREQAILDSTHAQLAYLDHDFFFVQVNDSYARGAGHSRQELLGRSHFDLFPHEENQAIFERVRDSGQPAHFYARPFVFVDQPERGVTYWDWSLVPVKDGAGRVEGLVLSLLDASDQVRATQAREQTLANLRGLTLASQEMASGPTLDGLLQRIVEVARELTGARAGTGRYGLRQGVFAARALSLPEGAQPGPLHAAPEGDGRRCVYSDLLDRVTSLRLSNAEMQAHPAWWGLPAGHAPLHGLLGARLVGRDGQASGLIMLTGKEEGEFSAEDEVLLGQLASLASLALQQAEARLEAERYATGLETYNAELSVVEEELRQQNEEMLRAHEALAAERRRYRELFELAPDGYLVTDRRGVVQEANRAAAQMLGLAPEALVGKPLSVYVAQEDRPALFKTLDRLRQGRQEATIDWEARLLPRQAEPFDAALRVVASHGDGTGVLRWLVRDVSERRQAERERERLLAEVDGQRRFIEAVAEHAPVGIAVLGARDLRARWTNPAYLAFLDEPYRSQGVEGLALQEFIPLAEESGVAATFRRVAASGQPHVDAEMAHAGFGRGLTYWNWSLQRLPAQVAEEEPDLLLLAWEVTEQVQSRQQVEEQAARLDAVFGAVSTGLILYDAEGRIVRTNTAAQALLGYPPAGHGRSPEERLQALPTVLGDDGRPLDQDEWPLMRAMRGETVEGAILGVRLPLAHDGAMRWFTTSLTPMHDAKGRVLGIANSFVDITELREVQHELERRVQARTADLRATNDELQAEVAARRQAEADLRESEARFRQLAQTIDEVFILAEPAAGRVLYVSPAFEALVARPAADLYDDPGSLLAALHPDDRARVAAAWDAGWAGQALEFRMVRPDGTTRWLRSRAFAVDRTAGAPARVAGVVADITLEKEAQAVLIQAERLSTAGRMAASLAHEMNNPLQAAVGCLGLLGEALAAGQDGQQYVQVASEALMRAAGVVAQLRALYGLPLGLAPQPADLNQILGRVLRWTRNQRDTQNVELDWQPVPDLPALRLVPAAIEQALLQLVLNALEAMPAGGTLRVSTELEHAAAGVWVRLADNGVGLSAEARARLFEPLRSTKPGNLGLGLFVSRHMVGQHGGRIEFESEEGRGSVFSLFLPAVYDQEPAAEQ